MRTCEFPDCGRKHVSRGYCAGHAHQLREGRELAPLRERRRRERSCQVPDRQTLEPCGKPVAVDVADVCTDHRWTLDTMGATR